MRIVSVSENRDKEKRISITPETAKKYLANGFEVSLSENYGDHLGFKDREYLDLGVKIVKDKKELIESGEIVIQLGLLSNEQLSDLKENQILIGVLDPFKNQEIINDLKKKNQMFFIRNVAKNYKSTINGYTFFTSKFGRL